MYSITAYQQVSGIHAAPLVMVCPHCLQETSQRISANWSNTVVDHTLLLYTTCTRVCVCVVENSPAVVRLADKVAGMEYVLLFRVCWICTIKSHTASTFVTANVYSAVITARHCKSSHSSYDGCRLRTNWPTTPRPSKPTWAVGC